MDLQLRAYRANFVKPATNHHLSGQSHSDAYKSLVPKFFPLGDRDILDIFVGRAHMLGLANGEKRMEGRWNSVGGKRVQSNSTCESSTLLIA
jgi:hypothetical protein